MNSITMKKSGKFLYALLAALACPAHLGPWRVVPFHAEVKKIPNRSGGPDEEHRPMRTTLTTIAIGLLLTLSSCSVYRERNWTGSEVTQAKLTNRTTYVVQQGSERLVRLDHASMDSTGLHGRLATADTARTPAVLHVKALRDRYKRRTTAVVVVAAPVDSLIMAGTHGHIAPADMERIFTDRKDAKRSRTRTLVLLGILTGVLVLLAVAAATAKPTTIRWSPGGLGI